jgi:hypothetical protein
MYLKLVNKGAMKVHICDYNQGKEHMRHENERKEGCGAGVPSIKNRIEMCSKSKVKGEMELE